MTCEISPRFHSRWRLALGRFFSPCFNPPQRLDLAAIASNPNRRGSVNQKLLLAAMRGLCASSSAKLGGHACWSCGLTECEFLVLSPVVHVDVAIGLHPVFVGFDGERADEA